jgi:uncharacterized membrane protein YhaH (DUF805 family)
MSSSKYYYNGACVLFAGVALSYLINLLGYPNVSCFLIAVTIITSVLCFLIDILIKTRRNSHF